MDFDEKHEIDFQLSVVVLENVQHRQMHLTQKYNLQKYRMFCFDFESPNKEKEFYHFEHFINGKTIFIICVGHL